MTDTTNQRLAADEPDDEVPPVFVPHCRRADCWCKQ